MVARYLVIIAGCVFVQALDSKLLNESDTKTASNNAYEALKNLSQATQISFPEEFDKFDKIFNTSKDFLKKIVPGHKRMLNVTLTEANNTLTRLQKIAEEKNIEITECLDGKLDKIKALGPPLIKEVEDCVAFTYKAANGTREVVNEMFQSVNGEALDLSIEINQCKDDECFNEVADKVKSLLAVLPVKISSIAKMANALLEKWNKETRFCYLQPQMKYTKYLEKTVEASRGCINGRLVSKILL